MSRVILALLALGVVSGCSGQPGSAPEPGDGRPSKPVVVPARAAARARGRVISERNVAWPAPESIDASAVAALAPADREALHRATVPVLLPRAPALLEAARLVVKPAFYAASIEGAADLAGTHLSISATKTVHRLAALHAEKTAAVRGGKPAWVLENEGIWSVTWEENGLSYVADLECARPGEDARCASADALVAIVEGLVFVGGSFGASEPGEAR